MIVRIYFDQDLRPGVHGLMEELKRKKVAIQALKETDLIVCVNRSRTIFKMISGSHHMVYYKALKGRIKLEDIKKVSQIFANTSFKSKKASTETLKVLQKGVSLFHDGDDLRVSAV